MAKVRLVIDPLARSSSTPAAFVVAEVANYVEARRQLYKHLEGVLAGDLEVIVRLPAASKWFDDLRGCPGLQYEVLSPSATVAAHLGHPLPPDLSEEDVVQLGLEQLAQQSKPCDESGQDWIMHHRLGEVWNTASPDWNSIRAIVSDLVQSPYVSNQWLLGEIGRRFSRWEHGATGLMRALWEYLKPDPIRRATALVAFAAIRDYPAEYCKAWLGDEWSQTNLDVFGVRNDIARQLEGVPAPRSLVQHLDSQARRYLRDKVGSANLAQLMTYITGTLPSEIQLLGHAFMDRPDALTPALFGRLVQLTAMYGRKPDRRLMDELREYLPVQVPTNLAPTLGPDDIETITEWTRTSYLPWYRSTRFRDERVPMQNEVCDAFAAWLGRSFPRLATQALHTVLSIRDRVNMLLVNGVSVIWLVVDALGAEWLPQLIAAFRVQGCTCTESRLLLTLLPTLTSVAKPSVLAGVPPILAEADELAATSVARYSAIVQQIRWSGSRAVLAAEWQQPTLRGVVSHDEADVWVYLVNRIDKDIVHQQMSYVERSRRISNVCTDLAERVQDAQSTVEARTGRRPAVIVTADHGFTTPAPGAQALVRLEGIELGERCIQLDEIGDGIQVGAEGWLVLSLPAEYGVRGRYALAVGNRFLGNASTGQATHGGANPEEVFVPFAVFDGIRPEIVTPRIFFLAALRPHVESQEAIVRIANPNGVPLSRLMIDCPELEQPIAVGEVGPEQEIDIVVRVRSAAWSNDTHEMTGLLQYAIGDDETKNTTIMLAVRIQPPLQERDASQQAFEEMFDD